MDILVIIIGDLHTSTKKVTNETKVCDLKQGEVGYVVPWALSQTFFQQLSGCVNINKNYSAYPKPHGTVCVKIVRDGSQILVDRSSLKYSDYNQTSWPVDRCMPAKFVNRIEKK